MKGFIILLLCLCPAIRLFAQAQDIYADIYLPTAGASATYDYRLAKHFEIGAGIQAFNYSAKYQNINSSVFLDLRPYWHRKKHILFILADVGLTRYLGDKPDPAKIIVTSNAFYTALGFGYCRTVTRRGMGPFVSLAMRGASRGERMFAPAFPEGSDYYVFYAQLFLSLGFKF